MNKHEPTDRETVDSNNSGKSGKQPRTVDTNREFMTVRDVAERLTLGTSTVWRLVRKGQFPSPIRIAGSTRWRRADIEVLIAREAA